MTTYNKKNYKTDNAIISALNDWTAADEVFHVQTNFTGNPGDENRKFKSDVWNCGFKFSRNQSTRTFFFSKESSENDKFAVSTKDGMFYATEGF